MMRRNFQLTNARAWIVGLLTAAIGVLGLVAISSWTTGTVRTVGQNVGATILSIGLITVAYDIFIRRTYTNELLELVQLSEHLASAGILRLDQEPGIDWAELLRPGQDFTLLLIDAAVFAEREFQHVLAASRARKTIVRIFLPHPESAAAKLLANHLSHNEDEFLQSLRRTQSTLENGWLNARSAEPPLHPESRLQIFHYDGLTTYSLICVDQRAAAVLSPACGRQPGDGSMAFLFNLDSSGAIASWLSNQRSQLTATDEVPVYDG